MRSKGLTLNVGESRILLKLAPHIPKHERTTYTSVISLLRYSMFTPTLELAFKKPLQSQEQEREDLKVVSFNAKVREKLVLANLRLALSLANEYSRKSRVPLDDLFQVAVIGLIKGVDRFDLSKKTKLSTYAYWWIRQALGDYTDKNQGPFKLTSTLRRRLAKFRKHTRTLATELGRLPSTTEMASRSGIELGEVVFLHTYLKDAHNLDCKGVLDEECMISDDIDDVLVGLDQELLHGQLLALMHTHLQPQQGAVLELKFGLTGRPPLKVEIIALELGLPLSKVRYYERTGMARLRKPECMAVLREFI